MPSSRAVALQKTLFFAGIVRVPASLSALRMLMFIVLLVVINANGRVKVLDVGRARLHGSDLFFVIKVNAELALGGQNGHRLDVALPLSDTDDIFRAWAFWNKVLQFSLCL